MNKFGYLDLVEELSALSPATMHGQLNTTAYYYKHRLLNKIIGAFEFGAIPDTWDINYFLYVLFGLGHISPTDTSAGLVALFGSPTGRNLYDQPITVIYANPVLGRFERTIGDNCTLIRLNPMMVGMLPMVSRYAELLASIDASINVNVVNSRTAYFAQATDKAEAEGLKRVLDEISRGKPSVFWRRKKNLAEDAPLPFQHVPVKDSYVADLLMQLKRDTLEDFDREIGFSLISKRERLISMEVDSNQAEQQNNIMAMMQSIQRGLDDTNAMFGTNITVKFAEEVAKGESDTIRSVQGEAEPV